MPELPEVETIRYQLALRLEGTKIEDIVIWKTGRETPVGREFVQSLIGRKIQTIERRAKLLIWRLDDDRALTAHLKMTGRFVFVNTDYQPAKHDRMLFQLSGGTRLVWADMRQFGFLRLVDQETLDCILDMYGPEPLEVEPAVLAERLVKPGTRKVKVALLNQEVIAGVGNIYADEACFRAGIHPTRNLGSLKQDDRLRLAQAIQEVLRESLARKGTSARQYVDTMGSRGAFKDFLRVYARAKQPCLICQTPIEKILVGQRGTHFCPVCQR